MIGYITVNGLARTARPDEFGNPEQAKGDRYQWLGTKRRAQALERGSFLMGQRIYVSSIGRFLQTDPVPGGSANTYDYANQDPGNSVDLQGTCAFDRDLAPSIIYRRNFFDLGDLPPHRTPPRPSRRVAASQAGASGGPRGQRVGRLVEAGGRIRRARDRYGDSIPLLDHAAPVARSPPLSRPRRRSVVWRRLCDYRLFQVSKRTTALGSTAATAAL